MKIKKILETKKEEEIKISGWVLSNRGNNKIRFITLNDGSTFENLQLVVKGELAKKVDSVRSGSAIKAEGMIKLTPDGKQPLELIVSNLEFKNSDEDYPLQKQGMSKEVLREVPHLRHRTNLFRAVFRVRSTMMLELHSFFNELGFLNVSSPVITGNDAEGAGESFMVDSSEGNFFGKKASLGVSGQLHAEAFANGFGDVYTFAPTFRAENSHTQKHVAEFWMLEPEMAFTNKEEAIKIADSMLKTVIKNTMEKHPEEFKFFNKYVDEELLARLDNFVSKGVEVITYGDAIKKLWEVKDKFVEKNIEFGLDLATEHERFIAEEIFKGPVAVTDYPKDIKAFYMKLNDDDKTVGAFDILVPGIGELIGGSERETDHQKLIKRINEMKLDQEELNWYLDLRRFGQLESSGFGLGFARLLMYVTGVKNIRDVIPYPRTPKNLKM